MVICTHCSLFIHHVNCFHHHHCHFFPNIWFKRFNSNPIPIVFQSCSKILFQSCSNRAYYAAPFLNLPLFVKQYFKPLILWWRIIFSIFNSLVFFDLFQEITGKLVFSRIFRNFPDSFDRMGYSCIFCHLSSMPPKEGNKPILMLWYWILKELQTIHV